ncbi:hypothetical protein P3T36_007303 [Kitasatospora sp. MAP12-15]|uniref:subtilase-type protease inhibitor n=1 Tax=unclassified Kitasatospora TaxID=2633591 RepID=UPI002473D4FF|nr:subtilase-type protease inhibitor [Kitasatospora sp. MAP12-44]MDH6115014.1 hypothetical protein [Kitasatospora sp. MAP12-44]
MRTQNRFAAVLTTALAAALALGVGTVSAAADAPAGPGVPGVPGALGMLGVPNALVLTVSGAAPNASDTERAVTLSCRPQPTGDHPDAAAACDSLLGVQGDFDALPVEHIFCPELYLPVVATAEGVWDGAQVDYQQSFTNECSLLRATGQVFDF